MRRTTRRSGRPRRALGSGRSPDDGSSGSQKRSSLMRGESYSNRDRTATELKRFQGSWRQVAYERDGFKAPLDDEAGWDPVTTFKGQEFLVTIADGSTPIGGTFTIDPTSSPKTVDWTDTIGGDAGKTLLAIYSLEGG